MEWLSAYLLFLVNTCISCFEVYIFWEAGKSFLPLRWCEKQKRNAVVLVGMVIVNVIMGYLLMPETLFVSCVIINLGAACWLFGGSILWKIIYVTFYMVVQTTSELIFYVIAFGIGVELDAGNKSEILWEYAIFGMISKLVAFFILILVMRSFSKGQIGKLPWRTFMAYLIMPLSSMFILFSAMSFQSEDAVTYTVQIGLVVSSVAVLAANAVLLHVFEEYAKSMELKRSVALSEQKVSLEAEHYQQLEDINRKNSRHLHDIKHILQSVRRLIESGETEQAQMVLQNVHQDIVFTDHIQYCRHSIINAVLSAKRDLAKKLEVDYQVEVDACVDTGSLRPEEVIGVLGNLLDNAIEAAADVPGGGYVRTHIRLKNHGTFLVIRVENNYEREPECQGNQLVTRKAEKERHGIGLKSISWVVKKHNGIEKILYENKIFIHQVALSTRR